MISRHVSALWRPCACSFGSVEMLKYDWSKIAEMHVSVKSLAVANLVPRVSLLCLPSTTKEGTEERPWKRACTVAPFVMTDIRR